MSSAGVRRRDVSRCGRAAVGGAASKIRHVFACASPQLAIVCVLMASSPLLSAQRSVSTEYRSKADFLVKFLDFIEWPEDAFPSARAPFLICVRGDFSFGTTLAEVARGSAPRGRRIDVVWLREDQRSPACQILFVSRSESHRYAKVLRAAAGPGVLTIGETPDFLEAGGAVNLIFKAEANRREHLQFEVNLSAASEAHLKISSKLLAIARRVVNLPEAKKG